MIGYIKDSGRYPTSKKAMLGDLLKDKRMDGGKIRVQKRMAA